MTLIPTIARILTAVVILFISLELTHAQVVEQIRANPSLWTLHSIWKVTGTYSGEGVGAGIGSVGDLNRDGLGDFAYYTIDPPVVGGIWRVHYGSEGGPSTDTAWVFGQGAGQLAHPVAGNYVGADSHFVGFLSYRWVDSGASLDVYYQLRLFRVLNDSLETTPQYVWDPGRTMDSTWFITPNDFIAVDMDHSEGDELVMVSGVSLRNRVRSQVGEIWFYQGGENFQVDQPTLVITDEQANTKEDEYRLYVADFDGDSFIDVALTARYSDGSKLKLWYGSEGSPWNWSSQPDRTIFIDGLGLGRQLSVADFDGDGVVDVASSDGNAAEPGTYIYLSSKGKSFRDRSFSYSDADVLLKSTQYQIPIGGGNGGYMGDSTGRYAMLGLIGPSKYDSHEPMLLLFGGGKNGPNGTWDAEYAPSRDGVTPGPVMQHIVPISDCDGDGWPDLLLSDDDWYLFDHGIAMVIAGGPEIPTDDTTLSVREVSTEEHQGALHIWPNPMVEELQIAWRGDLRRMPSRFTVHNALGTLVAEGEVEPGVGAAQWESRDTPSGMYLLTVYDSEGRVLATTEVLKVE